MRHYAGFWQIQSHLCLFAKIALIGSFPNFLAGAKRDCTVVSRNLLLKGYCNNRCTHKWTYN